MHLVFSAVTVLLTLMAMGFGAKAFRRSFRIYSMFTIILLCGLGIWISVELQGLKQTCQRLGWELLNEF
jgi:hypothetical protein